jgi:hypothetical protein
MYRGVRAALEYALGEKDRFESWREKTIETIEKEVPGKSSYMTKYLRTGWEPKE